MTNENKITETTPETTDEATETSGSGDENVTLVTDVTPTANEGVTTDEPESFPREYVEKLRKEAADNRAKAKAAEALQHEVFGLRVAALGKLHDASDMPFDPALLEDPDKLAQAVDELVTRKPYLARQVVAGSIGQGAAPATPSVSLIDALRG
ncbi:hypothetical protein EDD41_0416 [Luteococcus japonicus]|uniref:Scaffolding protein n=1 Tax=Luteococcus japonicus TaxID=33984 RepID=A0A3N1ZQV7_9ACTN|nr:hypothetical protein [Luteococcus japonicus]ROR53281.1 hypothetical protein EDD41_0416 [Luteococcus japonicus]